MKIILLILAVLILSGCGREEREPQLFPSESKYKKADDRCLETGGVPIYSEWFGALKECQYPLNK